MTYVLMFSDTFSEMKRKPVNIYWNCLRYEKEAHALQNSKPSHSLTSDLMTAALQRSVPHSRATTQFSQKVQTSFSPRYPDSTHLWPIPSSSLSFSFNAGVIWCLLFFPSYHFEYLGKDEPEKKIQGKKITVQQWLLGHSQQITQLVLGINQGPLRQYFKTHSWWVHVIPALGTKQEECQGFTVNLSYGELLSRKTKWYLWITNVLHSWVVPPYFPSILENEFIVIAL